MIQHPLKSQGQEAEILEGRDKYKRIDAKLLLITKEIHNSLRRALFHQPALQPPPSDIIGILNADTNCRDDTWKQTH